MIHVGKRNCLWGEQDLANKTMASILAMLDRLKATRASREGDRPAYETTPAEWASELLADSRERSGNTVMPARRVPGNIDGPENEPEGENLAQVVDCNRGGDGQRRKPTISPSSSMTCPRSPG